MQMWEFLGICGIIFIILEVFTPSMFFLNFAIAAFICAALSVIIPAFFKLVLIFFVLSFLSFAFLRPVIMKKYSKEKETGVNGKYIGKIAKAEEDITESSGVITIYGERWDARSENGEVIPKGSEVKIARNESIIMYVEKYER